MRDDELDRILSQEEEIAPSSGLTASIMGAVLQEAAAPAPIPFPWKRAIPGLAALAVALVSSLVYGILWFNKPSAEPLTTSALRSWASSTFEAAAHTSGGWVVAGILLSLVSVMISVRLVRARIEL